MSLSQAPAPSEAAHGWFRPALHAAMGLFALLLGVLPRWAAVGMALAAILNNWVLMPRLHLERHLRRPGEPFFAGLRTYPVAVLGLVLLLPPGEAAAAWGVLAFGDAAAALVGRALPAPALFGHRKATWSGTPAFFLVGTAAAFGLGQAVQALAAHAAWMEAVAGPSLPACAGAALAATLIDLVRLPPDDNLPCAAVAGTALWALRSVV